MQMAHHQTNTVSPYADLEQAGAAKTFVYDCNPAIRAGFIRKVYGILSMQLLATVGGAALFMFHQPTREFVLHTPAMFTVALLLPLGFLFSLHCYKDRHPINMMLLGGFTLCEAYTIGVVCATYYQAGMGVIVFQAFLLTAAVFLSLTTYVHVTKKDFTFMGAGLFACLMIVVVWGLLQMFFPMGPMGRMVFALLGALLFAGFILYDTSNLLHNHSPDDYIVASINLYLDIINLFLYLLEILRMLQGGSSD